jgi:hypothetical protein
MAPGEDAEIIFRADERWSSFRHLRPIHTTSASAAFLGAFLTLLLLHLYRLCSCSAGVDTPSERVDGSSSREK